MTAPISHLPESIIVGVDTHLDEHTAVAINHLGARQGKSRFPAIPADTENLSVGPLRWVHWMHLALKALDVMERVYPASFQTEATVYSR